MSFIRQITVHLAWMSAGQRFPSSAMLTAFRNSVSRVCVRPVTRIHRTLTNQLWPSMTYWPVIKATDLGNTAKDLESARNGIHVLRMLSSPEVAVKIEQNPELLRLFCRSLAFKTYMAYEKTYPYKAWMERDVHLAFEQLNSSVIQKTMAPILKDPQFTKLLAIVDRSFNNLSDDVLNECLMLLLYLGVDREHLLLRKMYVKARRDMQEKSWSSISDLLHAAKCLGRADYSLYAKILGRIKSDSEVGKLTEDQCELRSFLETVELCPALFSTKLCELVSVQLSRIFTEAEFMNDAQNITDWTKATVHIYKAANMTTQIHLEKCLLTLHEIIWTMKEQFSFLHISQIMRDMDKIYPDRAPPLFSMPDYVNEDSLCALEVKDLLVAVAFYKKEENSRLQSRLRDILQKELMAHCSIEFKPVVEHYELIFRILSKSALKGGLRDVLRTVFFSGFNQVLEVDPHRAYIQKVVGKRAAVFLRELVANLENFGIVTNRQRSIRLAHILAGGSEFDAVVCDEMRKVLNNCDIVSVAAILQALKHRDAPPFFVIDSIAEYIQRAVEKHKDIPVEQVSSLICYEWDEIVYRLFRLKQSRTNAIGTSVMKLLESWMSGRITYAIESLTMKRFILFDYYSPHILEFISQLVLENMCDIDNFQNARMKNILALNAHFSHKPQGIENLTNLALVLFDEAISENKLDLCISIMHDLSMLDIFPRKELQTLFSLENIHKVYRYCEENPHKAHLIVRCYSRLNLDVHVLRPELGIKRILDGMVSRYDEKDLSAVSLAYNENIYSFLVGICGGSIFVQRGLKLFDVGFDFLLGLDENGKPLTVGDKDFVWSSRDQRIAILSLDTKKFAMNDGSHLLASGYSRKRLLVALGYDVIIVNRHQWRRAQGKGRKKLSDAIFHCQNRNDLSPIPHRKR